MVVTIRNRLETSGDGTRPGLLSQESALQGAANAAETHAITNWRRDMRSEGRAAALCQERGNTESTKQEVDRAFSAGCSPEVLKAAARGVVLPAANMEIWQRAAARLCWRWL